MWNRCILWLLFVAMTSMTYCQMPVNIKRKEREMHKLLTRGVRFFKTHSIGESCHEFTRNTAWRKGELFIFVLGEHGQCYTFGNEKDKIWTLFSDYKDVMGVPLIKRISKGISEHGASMVINNSSMHIHVRKVEKDKKTYLLGCGFYPESPEYIVVDLYIERSISLMSWIRCCWHSNKQL